MIDVQTLVSTCDAYKAAAGIPEDSTVSYRVFGDTKKLAALRAGADITIGRFNAAMLWFVENWPEGIERPQSLECMTVQNQKGAA